VDLPDKEATVSFTVNLWVPGISAILSCRMKTKMSRPPFIGQAQKRSLVQPVMETRKAFTVETEGDFEKFAAHLTLSLKRANHAGWLAAKGTFQSLVRLTKTALPYKRPRTLYVVESPHRIAWEENHGALGIGLIFQIPKPCSAAPSVPVAAAAGRR
jgi:hypothetical protein